jgi:hypothetical protein
MSSSDDRVALLYFYEIPEDWEERKQPEQLYDPLFLPHLKGVLSFTTYSGAKALVDEICDDCLKWAQRNTQGFHFVRGKSKSGHDLLFQLAYNELST